MDAIVAVFLFGAFGFFLAAWEMRQRRLTTWSRNIPLRGLWIRRRLRREVLRYFPLFLDGFSLLLETGIDVRSAFARAIPLCPNGLFSFQLRSILAELSAGGLLSAGLQRLANHSHVDSLRILSGFIRQSERFGTPLAELLRSQAERERSERFCVAERRGIRAAQKLMIPLVFGAMPASFIVIFAPLAVRISQHGWQGVLW